MGMPTADLTDSRGHQQRGQCFARARARARARVRVLVVSSESSHCQKTTRPWTSQIFRQKVVL